MGCCHFIDAYTMNPKLEEHRSQFEALQLTETEVTRLYKIFKKVDVDGSGSIELIELLVHIDVERTKFSERIFSIFDEDASGEIDFREFVLALWNYCTLSRATLDLFAFDLYDRDSSGALSIGEIAGMCRDIYGHNFKSNPQARQIVKELREGKVEDEAGIDIDIFREFSRTHQALLFPAFLMQELLQKKILGKSFWEKNANRRIELSRGKFIPIAKFMEIHLNKNLFNSMVDSADKGNVNRKSLLIMENTGTHAARKQAAIGEKVDSFIGLNYVNKPLQKKGAMKDKVVPVDDPNAGATVPRRRRSIGGDNDPAKSATNKMTNETMNKAGGGERKGSLQPGRRNSLPPLLNDATLNLMLKEKKGKADGDHLDYFPPTSSLNGALANQKGSGLEKKSTRNGRRVTESNVLLSR